MNNRKNIEKTEKYQEQIKELFKEMAATEVYDAWADTFEIESVDEKQVTVIYHGIEDFKVFKKECKETLSSCIYSVVGEGKKIKISKRGIYEALSPKARKNIKAVKFFAVGMVFVCLATAIIVVLCSYISNRNFRESFYNVIKYSIG